MVGWIPDVTTALTAPTLQQLSACQPVILSASTQDTATITIPALHAVEWIKLTEVNPAEVGALVIRPLVPLIVPTGASSTIEVSIYARFINPQVTGYVKQMKKVHNKEASKKDDKGIDAKATVNVFSRIARAIPIVGEVWSPIADILNVFAGDLSKPTSNQAYTKTIATNENAAFVSGEYFGDPLSMYPNAQMEQSATMYGMETSHMSITDLVKKPMLLQVVALSAGNTTFPLYQDPKECLLLGLVDYVYYASLAHKRWRGSFKYSLYFCCNAFYCTRVRIQFYHGTRVGIANNDDLPHQIVEIKGDTWHDFTVPYQRQFLWSTTDSAMTLPTCPQVNVSLEAPIVGENLPATPTIYCCVFKSAGEDFQFAGLQNVDASLPNKTPEFYRKQVSLVNRFSKTFPPILEGCKFGTEHRFITPETTQTVSDCLKRWSTPHRTTLTGVVRYTYPAFMVPATHTSVAGEPYHWFAALYKYWRGGRRYAFWSGASATSSGISNVNYYNTNPLTYPGNGIIGAMSNPKIEVPWLSEQPFAPTSRLSCAYPGYPDDIFVGTSYPADTNAVVSGADDFVCLHLLWPEITPVPSATARPPAVRPSRTGKITGESLHFSHPLAPARGDTDD